MMAFIAKKQRREKSFIFFFFSPSLSKGATFFLFYDLLYSHANNKNLIN